MTHTGTQILGNGSTIVYNQLNDEIDCPLEEPSTTGGNFVTKEYCESFSQGEGCRYIKRCKAYAELQKIEELQQQQKQEERNPKKIIKQFDGLGNVLTSIG